MSDQLPGKLEKIDPGKLKLRELAEVEKLVGRKLAGELQTGELGMDTMQALLWMQLRKHDPATTFEQAGEYDLETLMDAFGDDEPDDDVADPTSPPASAGNGSSLTSELISKPMQPSITSGG